MLFNRLFGSISGSSSEERNGLLYQKGKRRPYTGLVITDTRDQRISHILKDTPSSEIQYKDGLKHGLSRVYHFNKRLRGGSPFPEDTHIKDIVQEECEYSEGKKNGFRKLYDKQGGILIRENYKNDQLHGLVYVYGDRSKEIRGNFQEGKLVPYTKKDDEGNLLFELFWKKDKEGGLIKKGTWKYYSTLKSKSHYLSREEVHDDLGRCTETRTYFLYGENTLKKFTKKDFDSETETHEEYWDSSGQIKLRFRRTFNPWSFYKEEYYKDGRPIRITENIEGNDYKVTDYDPWTDEKSEWFTKNTTLDSSNYDGPTSEWRKSNETPDHKRKEIKERILNIQKKYKEEFE